MPVLIMLDASLSMLMSAADGDGGAQSTSSERKLDVGVVCAQHIVDHVRDWHRSDPVALATFNHAVRSVVEFTRDHQSAQTVLHTARVPCRGRTDLLRALAFAKTEGADRWRQNTACMVFVITDGCVAGTLPEEKACNDELANILPFANTAGRLHFVLLDSARRCQAAAAGAPYNVWHAMLAANGQTAGGQGGNIDGCPSITCVESMAAVRESMQAVLHGGALKRLAPTTAVLACGALTSAVSVSPRIVTAKAAGGATDKTSPPQLYTTVHIVGFVRPAVVGTAPLYSRHLLLPHMPSDGDVDNGRRVANLCVLLHGAIRVQPMAALCLIGPQWYGLIVPVEAGQSGTQGGGQAASSKRSNLSLNVLYPGVHAIPWLGDLSRLAPLAYSGEPPKGNHLVPATGHMPKCSYAMPNTNWADGANFSADVTKLLRFANKLPNKAGAFYLELNRLVRHAQATGLGAFADFLAGELDEEARAIAGADVKRHFHYASAVLRSRSSSEETVKFGTPIAPMPADYQIT